MASVAYSLQGPRFRATMGFLHASFSTAKFACQSYVLLLFALHFYGSCGDNAARFRRVFDARFLARFAAGSGPLRVAIVRERAARSQLVASKGIAFACGL